MNSSFDFSRFITLIRRQWLSFGKIYLMSLGVVAGIFICFYGFSFWDSMEEFDVAKVSRTLSFRPFVFIIFGLLFMTVVASTYFSSLGDKSKAIFELLIPASSLEKFLTAIFYTFIVPAFSFCFLFFVIDVAFVSYERHFFADFLAKEIANTNLGMVDINDYFNYFFTQKYPEQLYYMLFLPVLLSSLFLLGSIYFSKFHYIKTAITLIIYLIVFVFLVFKIMTWATSGTISVDNSDSLQEEMYALKIICTIGAVVTLIIWCIGYLRLKEKEV